MEYFRNIPSILRCYVNFYLISPNYSSFRYSFLFKNFLFTVPRSWFHHSYCLSQILPSFHFPFRLVFPSPGFFGALLSSYGLAVETIWNDLKLYVVLENQRIIDGFSLSHACPHFPICLSDSFITSLSRDDPSSLALPIIQTFHEAHTNRFFLHAAILRTF